MVANEMSNGQCPACGEPNDCRMASGDAYKGLCWCEALAVDPRALERLLGDRPEKCLCARCLGRIAAHPGITWEELLGASIGGSEEPDEVK